MIRPPLASGVLERYSGPPVVFTSGGPSFC